MSQNWVVKTCIRPSATLTTIYHGLSATHQAVDGGAASVDNLVGRDTRLDPRQEGASVIDGIGGPVPSGSRSRPE